MLKKTEVFLVVVIAMVAVFSVAVSVSAADDSPVKIFTADGFKEKKSFYPYGKNFSGGIAVAVGDVNSDGEDELITASGKSAKTHIRSFDRFGNPLSWNIFPFSENYKDGASLAIGNFDDDSAQEIAVAPSGKSAPLVSIYNFGEAKPETQFYVFNDKLRTGVNIAALDTDSNGKDDIAAATASGNGQVAVYNSNGKFTGLSFFPFGDAYKNGLSIAAGNVTGDENEEIIVGSQGANVTRVKVYKANESKKEESNFLAYGGNIKVGVNVASWDINGDGKSEIVTAIASGAAPHVRAFDVKGTPLLSLNIFPYDKTYKNGVNLAVSSDWLVFAKAQIKATDSPSGICKIKKCVALTFDDGGSKGGSFEGILASLKKHNVKATFFLIGKWVDKNREWAKKVVNDGHRLGNHTWNHSICTKIPDAQIRSELEQADSLIKLLVGKPTKPHFRYPGGGHDARTDAVVIKEGYRFWQWTSDPRDAMGNHSPESIKNIALSGLHANSVILFHTGNPATAQALDGIIASMKNQGYELVTLDEIEWSKNAQW